MSKRREKRKKQQKIYNKIKVKDPNKVIRIGQQRKTREHLIKETEEMRKAGKIVNCNMCGRDLSVPKWIQDIKHAGEKTNTMTLECKCGGWANVIF